MRSSIEISRNLALPSYMPEDEANDLLRNAIQWESESSRDLMVSVSLQTSRSENFKRISGQEGDRLLVGDQFIRLDGLEL
jgi:hypothetical protein